MPSGYKSYGYHISIGDYLEFIKALNTYYNQETAPLYSNEERFSSTWIHYALYVHICYINGYITTNIIGILESLPPPNSHIISTLITWLESVDIHSVDVLFPSNTTNKVEAAQKSSVIHFVAIEPNNAFGARNVQPFHARRRSNH